jgi:hypothetical protein
MDWDYPVKDFFKLSIEKREEYLLGLAKFFYDKHVVTDSRELFDVTMNDLIFTFIREENMAKKYEDYERAEIYYKLGRLFMEIQEEKQI